MKKFVLAIFTVFGLSNFASAQTEAETVNWLSNNIGRIDNVNCPTLQLFGDNFVIDNNGLKLYNEVESCSIKWNEIKDVKTTKDFIFVISEKEIKNKPVVLKFYINNQEDAIHFESGFKHLAELENDHFVKK